MRTLLSFSLWTSVQSITTFVQRGAPALLLNRYSSAIDVAAFHIGNLPNLQLQKLIQAASVASTQELTALYAREGEEALRPLYYRGGRYFLWGSLFLLPPLIAFAKELMLLYAGAAYADAALVLVLVLALYPFSGGSAMYHRFAYAVGQIKAYNAYSFLLAVAGLAMMYLFVAVLGWGAEGAALGLFCGFGLVHVGLLWPMGLKMVHANWPDFVGQSLVPGIAPFLATLAACLFLSLRVEIDSWTRFLLGCGFAGVTYTLLAGLCLDQEDRSLILRKVRGLRARLSGRR
jgi:O-antigen/teichoic acid export membrane protein